MTLRVLGISGSLRNASLNSALLRAAVDLAPATMRVEVFDGLRDVPPYDGDLDTDTPPTAVARLRHAIGSADALLLSSPEYNYGVPGVLKNALDWASRPVATTVLRDKPVAIMGASPGNFGTVRGQLALRQVLIPSGTHVVTRPEVLVFQAPARFDGGRLTDEVTAGLVTELLGNLALLYRNTATPS